MTRDEEIAAQLAIAIACKDMEGIESIAMSEVVDKGCRTTALMSIAISLKRIADKLELSQKQPILMIAEEHKQFIADQFVKNGM